MEFAQIITLHSQISSAPFKCLDKPPQISVVENLEKDYVLKIKKTSPKKPCRYCCIKNLTNALNLRVTEDESYITIHSC